VCIVIDRASKNIHVSVKNDILFLFLLLLNYLRKFDVILQSILHLISSLPLNHWQVLLHRP
jgi:hypothetical protein